jgi:hypothetical protein
MPGRLLGQAVVAACLLFGLLFLLYQPSGQPQTSSSRGRRTSGKSLVEDARNSTLGVGVSQSLGLTARLTILLNHSLALFI